MTHHEHSTLKKLLKEMISLRYQGVHGADYARSQGLADGYMRALVEMGATTDKELLLIIRQVQSEVISQNPQVTLLKASPAVPKYAI